MQRIILQLEDVLKTVVTRVNGMEINEAYLTVVMVKHCQITLRVSLLCQSTRLHSTTGVDVTGISLEIK